MFSVIDFQFDKIATGIIIVVNKTKYIEIPSTPKYRSYSLTLTDSNTNWKLLFEKSKKKINNNDNKKLQIVINKAMFLFSYCILVYSLIKGLHNRVKTPNRGKINREKSIIYLI